MSTPTTDSAAAVECCCGTNAQGRPCGSPARPGSTYCFRHDPERAAASSDRREVEPPRVELPGPITDAKSLRELLAQVIHYAATSPAPDLARVHAISAIAGPLLRSFEKQELETQLAAAQAQIRALQDAQDRLRAEAAALRALQTPPSVQELADARRQAADSAAALAASTNERRVLERDLHEAHAQIETLTARLCAGGDEQERLNTELADTTLVDRLCYPCIRELRSRNILGAPAHEDDPDWPRPRR